MTAGLAGPVAGTVVVTGGVGGSIARSSRSNTSGPAGRPGSWLNASSTGTHTRARSPTTIWVSASTQPGMNLPTGASIGTPCGIELSNRWPSAVHPEKLTLTVSAGVGWTLPVPALRITRRAPRAVVRASAGGAASSARDGAGGGAALGTRSVTSSS